MRILLSLFCLFLLSSELKAQEGGYINIIATTNIDAIVNKHIRINSNRSRMSGYRIQLAQNSSRSFVLEKKNAFLQKFPNIRTYMVYEQPYFKLRVGNYESKLEAFKMYRDILRNFGNAFIVEDFVDVESY